MRSLKTIWKNDDALGVIGGLVSQYIGLFAFEIIGDIITGIITGVISGAAGVYTGLVGWGIGGIGWIIGGGAGVINFLVSGAEWVAGLFGFG